MLARPPYAIDGKKPESYEDTDVIGDIEAVLASVTAGQWEEVCAKKGEQDLLILEKMARTNFAISTSQASAELAEEDDEWNT